MKPRRGTPIAVRCLHLRGQALPRGAGPDLSFWPVSWSCRRRHNTRTHFPAAHRAARQVAHAAIWDSDSPLQGAHPMAVTTLERPPPPPAPPPAPTAAPQPPAAVPSLVAPLAAIVLGTFMVILDNTVVNVALPTLGRVFQTNLALLQWVITAYMLAQAAVIPLSCWLSDRFGAKRIYLTSLVLFTLGSALCGLAQSGGGLVATRVLQGLG